jgi:hypothetical protein
MKKENQKVNHWIDYYDRVDILPEFSEDPAEFILDDQLRHDILSKKRKRRLQNVTIKMDPLQIQDWGKKERVG